MDVLKRDDLIEKIIDFDSRDTVLLLTGVRMSGKTTLIKSVIDELKSRGVSEGNIFYLSFRSMDYYSASSYEIYQNIKDKIDGIEGKIHLFFDHVEEFENWQFVVNSFRSWNNCDVTAAINYSQFYTLGHNSLGGRSLFLEVYPFSFKEFLQFKKEFTDEDKSDKEFFIEYLKYGGMPEVVQQKDCEKFSLLKTIYRIIRYEDFIKEIDADSFLINDFLRYMIL
ncbi:AAA family ATPase, partial [uncultured Methanobrevibacter sp.]|uniref:AAA family ATPase n=1 Tax=uncultured Methanobrevibacter sp. TaxID=253161 RepID=UPI002606338F